jgi:transposase-like protein
MQEEEPGSVIEALARRGAQQILATALGTEIATFVEKFKDCVDENGRRQVVRNGYHPERSLVTGIGKIPIKQPRIHDRRNGVAETERFNSGILPRYMRRVTSVDKLIPVLYLKGISTGDFSEALAAILGPDAPGLSATNIVRLKAHWEEEYKEWCRRDLSKKQYAYIWVDGIHTTVRLDDEKSCILVVMGADCDGHKELIAVSDGYRESKENWREILLDLKKRGLKKGPAMAIGDGALGFWAALREEYPSCREQRCWFHKTGNVLNKLPKSIQSKAKGMLQEVWKAPGRTEAKKAMAHFKSAWEAKYPKAVECLMADESELLAFFDFPAEHWSHIRTTNPIESTYATVRLRTKKTKGCGSRTATLTMVFKLAQDAEKSWRRLMGYKQIVHIMAGRRFNDGMLEEVA